MYQVIIVIHVLLGLSVISLVLLQQGKGADAGAAFGSASSGSVFGAQGASSFLSRATAILATLFFATSLGLAILIGHQEGEANLMDAPEVEEVITDLPVVNGNAPVTDSAPILGEDVPAAISDEVSQAVDTTSGAVQSVVEDTQNLVPDATVDTEGQ